MAVTAAQVQALYIAYFNRPADFFGLTFQVNQANQFGLNFVADQFSKSPEFIATYAGKGTAEIVDTIYMNLFGRHAEPAGLKFWGDLLTDPKSGITLGNAALTIFNGAINDDKVAVTNKLTAAQSFYDNLDTNAEIVGYSGDAANQVAKQWMSTITDNASLTANTTALALATVMGNTITAHDGATAVVKALTTGIDTVTGTSANDSFNGTLDTTGGTGTFSTLDTIDGSGGTNTLNINDLDAAGSNMPAGVTVSNVQTVNLRAAGIASFDASSGFTGLTTLNVLQSSGNDSITVGGSTAANVTDTKAGGTVTVVADSGAVTVNAAGLVTVGGGTSQTVNTAGGVALDGATGAITVVDTAQGAQATTVNDGTNVNVTTTSTGTGAVTIGKASHMPSGTVTLVQTVAGTGALTGGATIVNGGTVDNITINATQATTNTTTTIAKVQVNGSTATTSVTVNESAAVTAAAAVTAVTGVKLVDTLVFTGMTAGQDITVGGLKFTATGTLTATQTAAAFANLAAGATHGSSTLGAYSGTFTGFSTGANTTTSLTVTGPATTGAADVVVAATGATAPSVTQATAGVTAVTANAGKKGIANGAVEIVDAKYSVSANSITSATVGNYATASFVKSDALTSLSLASSAGTFDVYNNTATTLGMTLNGVTGAINIDKGAAKYTTLNITTATKDSASAVTAAAVTALTVAGSNAVDLTGSTLSAVKTVTVTGAAGLTLDASGATVTAVNTSATTGNSTLSVDGSKATFTGGAGVDTVTLTSTTVSKAISMGAGDDSLVLASGTTATTANVDGGAGTGDNLTMVGADAATASATSAFATKVTGFERLTITTPASTTIDLTQLGNYSYVSQSGAVDLTLNTMLSGGTTVITGASTKETVNVTNAATGTADVLNVVVKNAAGIAAGTVVANNIETINLTSTDTTSTHAAGTNTNTLTLTADSVTKLVVTGNANLTLTSANTTVTSVDASGMTGGLNYTAAGTVSETVKGGAAANALTASTGTIADVLIGGAGNDVLTGNKGLSTLTGGAGADTFVAVVASNLNTYTTVTDAAKGDKVTMVALGAETFTQAKISLAPTAVFQDYVNAAINAGGDAHTNAALSWFQYGGDTYIIESMHDATTTHDFQNGTDTIIKLTGAVDLSTATLNNGAAPVLLIN